MCYVPLKKTYIIKPRLFCYCFPFKRRAKLALEASLYCHFFPKSELFLLAWIREKKLNLNTQKLLRWSKVQLLVDSQAKISALTFSLNLFDCSRRERYFQRRELYRSVTIWALHRVFILFLPTGVLSKFSIFLRLTTFSWQQTKNNDWRKERFNLCNSALPL